MRCVQQVTILEFSQRSVAQPSTRALKSCRSAKLRGRSQFVPGSWHEGGIYIVSSGTYLRGEQFWGRAVRAYLIRKSQGRFSFLAQDKTQTSFHSPQAFTKRAPPQGQSYHPTRFRLAESRPQQCRLCRS